MAEQLSLEDGIWLAGASLTAAVTLDDGTSWAAAAVLSWVGDGGNPNTVCTIESFLGRLLWSLNNTACI